MPRSINGGGEGGGGGGGIIGMSSTPTKPIASSSHKHKHRTPAGDNILLAVPKQEPINSNDDLASTDEIKVYKDEGAGEEEEQNLDNLNEDKIGLVNETEDVSSFFLNVFPWDNDATLCWSAGGCLQHPSSP